MSFFLLPRAYLFLYKQIDYKEKTEEFIYSPSLTDYLYRIKEKITTKEKLWDSYKKYTNPYEYIHTIVPLKKKSVSKYKPLSRSFFKMIEMITTFRIQYKDPIRTFQLAEGPGGFIEAMVFLRNNEQDQYIGMTLLDTEKNDHNIPAWKKTEAFLKANPNVLLENGADKTGNLLSIENFEYVVSKYMNTKMDLVTGDGGFDFSMDFNQQEQMIGQLLFAQMAYALCLNKKGGNFILKIFDCFMPHTVDVLYILSSFYEKVYIMKPNTSRYANSEKYIICLGFLHDSHVNFYPYLLACFKKMCENPDGITGRFLDIDVPQIFYKKIEEYNAIFGQKQIQNIMYTLSLMENKNKSDKIENMLQTNIQKSMDWCNRFHIPFHSLNIPTNIFLE